MLFSCRAWRFRFPHSSRSPGPLLVGPTHGASAWAPTWCFHHAWLLGQAQVILSRSSEDSGFLRNTFLSVLIVLALFILERL